MIYQIIAVAIILTIFWLVASYFRVYASRTKDIEFYQDRLFKAAKAFIEDEKYPAELGEFAQSLFDISGQRNATTGFISTFGRRKPNGERSPLGKYLETAPEGVNERVGEMVFDFLMILRLRSVFFGWMVFAIAMTAKSKSNGRPRDFNDLSAILARRINSPACS